MKILAHRGYWKAENEKNSMEALKNALDHGYGFESDVRDYAGKMVISHNIADGSSPDAEQVFAWLQEAGDTYCFAINIKADGLKEILKEYLERYQLKNYFLFDMSVPQMVEFKEAGLRFFTRQSELEKYPVMYEEAAGVWVDGFWSTEWITEDLLKGHLSKGKEVCIVSADLHGNRNYRTFWQRLKSYDLNWDKVLLCTDYPDEAREFFYGQESKSGTV